MWRFGAGRRVGEDGRFKLVHRLGEDAIGAVWRAHDAVSGGPLTLRMVRPPLGTDRRFVERLQLEVQDLVRPRPVDGRLMPRLSHPNAARPLGVEGGNGSDPLFVVMEPLEGRMLNDVLGEGQALEAREALWIAAQLAHAVQTAHDAGIVHGLIHPGCVIRSPWGRAVLIDFGLMARVDLLESTEDLWRSLGPYRSPGTDGQAPVPASDVYSLGAVLFAMLAGRRTVEQMPPSSDESDPEGMEERGAVDRQGAGTTEAGTRPDAASAEAGSLPPDVPLEVGRVCLAALDADPEARPSAAAFRSALTPFLVPPGEDRSGRGLPSE
jgi:serine/threonine protein kinase